MNIFDATYQEVFILTGKFMLSITIWGIVIGSVIYLYAKTLTSFWNYREKQNRIKEVLERNYLRKGE